ncbi:hypothetical protein Hamer_G014271, partial [Homarus americanus]
MRIFTLHVKHENHAHWLSPNVDLTKCLDKLCTVSGDASVVDVIIQDGAAIINMLKPMNAKTFQEYATLVFLPNIKSKLNHVTRVYIIWVAYLPMDRSISSFYGEGSVHMYRVFLAPVIIRMSPLYHRVHMKRLTKRCSYMYWMQLQRGYCRIMLLVMDDTNVVVLAMSSVMLFEDTELWMAFGTGKHLRYTPAHDIAKALGVEKARVFPMFHVLIGCGTVSSFAGKGNKTVFGIWKSYDEVTTVFTTLSESPTSFNKNIMSMLPLQSPEDGRRVQYKDENHSGHYSPKQQKQQHLIRSCYNVVAKKECRRLC